jgi:hypothetical protein
MDERLMGVTWSYAHIDDADLSSAVDKPPAGMSKDGPMPISPVFESPFLQQ